MMNRKHNIFLISLLIIILVLEPPVKSFADEKIQSEEGFVGKLPIYLIEKNHQVMLDVYYTDQNLYVKSTSFANRFGLKTAESGGAVEFMFSPDENKKGYGSFIIGDFTINSNKVWLYDGYKRVDYEAPIKTIKDDNGVWIPLQFALKIFGSELFINGTTIFVSPFHKSEWMITDSVYNSRSKFFNVINTSNQVFIDPDNKDQEMLSLILSTQQSIDSWFYEYIDEIASGVKEKDKETVKESLEKSIDKVEEMVTYLVSNLGPENNALYSDYGNRIMMYFSPFVFSMGEELLLGNIIEENEWYQKYNDVLKDIGSNVSTLVSQNPRTARYNDEMRRTCMDFVGYDPVNDTYGNDAIYADILASLVTYSGDINMEELKELSSAGSLVLSNQWTSILVQKMVDFKCAKNKMADSDYACTLYKNYIEKRQGTKFGESAIFKELKDRTYNYDAHQDNLASEYSDAYFSRIDWDSEIIDLLKIESLEVFVDKMILTKKGAKYIEGRFDNAKKLVDYMTTEFEPEKVYLLPYYSAYTAAKNLADDIAHYVIEEDTPESAYIYYRTDFVSKLFYREALAAANKGKEISGDDKKLKDRLDWAKIYVVGTEIRDMLTDLMERDIYEMANIRSGIKYGLNIEDNQAYNETYDDEPLLKYLVNSSYALGNSNGNINACGFAAEGNKHIFKVKSNSYEIYMVDLEGEKEKKICDGKWGHWLNVYIKDDKEYLLFIDEKQEIWLYDVENDSSVHILPEGSYSKMFVVGDTIYAVENGNLYAINIVSPNLFVGRELVLPGVGNYLAFDENYIYYNTSDKQVYRMDYDVTEIEALGFRSDSFDLFNGDIYYSNLDDEGRIYLYYTSNRDSKKISDTAKAYCLNCYNNILYFKIDDGKSSGFVYSIIPYLDFEATAVYSWKGADKDWGVKMTDKKAKEFRDERRQFNICSGNIYNEGYIWELTEMPLSGFSFDKAIGYIGSVISEKVSEEFGD